MSGFAPPPWGGLGRSSRPSPGAGADTSVPAIFIRRDHEPAGDLPRGTLPHGGRQPPASDLGVPLGLRSGCVLPGCLGSGGRWRRGFWRGCSCLDGDGGLRLREGAACLALEASRRLILWVAEIGRAQPGSCRELLPPERCCRLGSPLTSLGTLCPAAPCWSQAGWHFAKPSGGEIKSLPAPPQLCRARVAIL